jgi:hypothetical protein
MDDNTIDPDETIEAILTFDDSDEALEAAASMTEGPAHALSFNFTSYHLSCC